jgi:hypothetical protein
MYEEGHGWVISDGEKGVIFNGDVHLNSVNTDMRKVSSVHILHFLCILIDT